MKFSKSRRRSCRRIKRMHNVPLRVSGDLPGTVESIWPIEATVVKLTFEVLSPCFRQPFSLVPIRNPSNLIGDSARYAGGGARAAHRNGRSKRAGAASLEETRHPMMALPGGDGAHSGAIRQFDCKVSPCCILSPELTALISPLSQKLAASSLLQPANLPAACGRTERASSCP
jgi:hypothetical protein